MPGWSTLSLFLGTTLVLVFLPGPVTIHIVARSIEYGPRAGIISSMGVQVGTLFYVVAAAAGLSSLLSSSIFLFNLLKYVGAAYLIYLGARSLFPKEKTGLVSPLQKAALSRLLYQGIFVNLLNPKAGFFIFAFLPQFVDLSRGSVAMQIVWLGAVLIFLGMLSDSTYALLAGRLGKKLRQTSWFSKAQRYFRAGVYTGLGLFALLIGNS